MSDFVQTMKDWRRMCQHMEKIGGDRSCDICPLGGCNAIYEDDGNTDYANVGEKVAAWAAENPEPVYPTWLEWLKSKGVVPYIDGLTITEYADGGFSHAHVNIKEIAMQPIPADIAEKLGIKPKEDV
jgi:hypothetical protein